MLICKKRLSMSCRMTYFENVWNVLLHAWIRELSIRIRDLQVDTYKVQSFKLL